MKITKAVRSICEKSALINECTTIKTNEPNILLGVGMISNGYLSKGLNPCFISMVVICKNIQQELSKIKIRSQIIVLIADYQAISTGQLDKNDLSHIKDITKKYINTIERLFKFFKIKDYEIKIASKNKQYNMTYEDIMHGNLASVLKQENIGIKIGWITKRSNNNNQIKDTKFFDKNSKGIINIYTNEGISLAQNLNSNQMTNLPPYVSDNKSLSLGSSFNLIDHTEEISKKISKPASKQIKNYFSSIGKEVKRTLSLDLGNLDSVQKVIDFCATEK